VEVGSAGNYQFRFLIRTLNGLRMGERTRRNSFPRESNAWHEGEGGKPMEAIWGTGAMFYGDSESNPDDGSYVTTKWVTVLFIPLFP
jgi:hypothetical protein